MRILFSEVTELLRALKTGKFTPGAINFLLLILLFVSGALALIFDENGVVTRLIRATSEIERNSEALDPTIWLLFLTGASIASIYIVLRTQR